VAAIPVFRRILKKHGVKLASRQVRQGETRMMVYQIERTNLEVLQHDARIRAAWLEFLSKNADREVYIRDFRHAHPDLFPTLPESTTYDQWQAQIDSIPI